MSQSSVNSYRGPILAGSSFTGKIEVINGSISIVCLLRHTVSLVLNVYQSPDGVSYVLSDTFNASVPLTGNQSRVQFYTKGVKGYIQVQNLGGVDDPDVILRTLFTPNNHDGTKLQPSYVIVEGMPTPGPISGTVAVSNFPAIQDVSGSVAVSNFPAIQDVSGSVAVSNFPAIQDVSGSVAVSNFPLIQDVSGSVAVSNFPAQQLVAGENSNFEFYPTPANNTLAIAGGETQGTNVVGGWKYTNAITGKINWYCYSSATPANDYKVSQLNSLYTVINQQSTLGLATAQNPFIIMYTRPTSTATTWYQNKFFWGSNALTDTTGVRLLYTGADPVGVHPEIVAPNRIQLDFKPLLSTSTIALSQDESVWLGSLQTTNNTTPAGSFDFTLQEFGVDWVKTPAVLPIEFGKVQVDIAGQSVIVSSAPFLSKTTSSIDISGQSIVVSGTVATDISGQSVVVSSAPFLSKTTSSIDISGQTVVVGGTIDVNNFPAVQDISGNVIVSNLPLITQAGTEGVFCKVSATYIGDSTTQDSSIVCYATQGLDNLNRLQIADPSDIPNGDLRELRTTDNSGNILLASIDGKITACNTGAVVISSGTVGLTPSIYSVSFNAPVISGGFAGATYDMSDNSVVDILLLATGTIVSGAIRLDYSADGTIWFPNNTTTYTISTADPHLTIVGLRTGSRYIRISTGVASTFRADGLQYIYTSKRG